jgi:hypothetical protein
MADEETGKVDETVEKEARSMGWVPKEEFRGGEEAFVDAKTFVERGRVFMPILQKNNERLQKNLRATEARLESAEAALKATQATIDALEESREEDVKARVEAARKQLKEELIKASRDGDHESVAELTDQMTRLNAAEAEEEDRAGGNGKGKNKKDAEADYVAEAAAGRVHPEVKQWYKDNADFVENPRKVALANVIAQEMRASGDTRIGAVFLDEVAQKVDEEFGGAAGGRGPSRVEGGGGGGGRRGSSGPAGKTYNDLPADAKAVCDKQAARLVGPNRAHKDIASWRASYTKQFFGEQS